MSGLKPAVVEKKRITAGWTVLVGSNANRARVGNAAIVREDADFLFASFLLGAKPRFCCSKAVRYDVRDDMND